MKALIILALAGVSLFGQNFRASVPPHALNLPGGRTASKGTVKVETVTATPFAREGKGKGLTSKQEALLEAFKSCPKGQVIPAKGWSAALNSLVKKGLLTEESFTKGKFTSPEGKVFTGIVPVK